MEASEDQDAKENMSFAAQFIAINKLLEQLNETDHKLESENNTEETNARLKEYQEAVNMLTDSIATLLEQSNRTKEELDKIIRQLVDTIEKKKQMVKENPQDISKELALDRSKIDRSLESIKKISENQGFALDAMKNKQETIPKQEKSTTPPPPKQENKTIIETKTTKQEKSTTPQSPKKEKQYNEVEVMKKIDIIVKTATENENKLEKEKDEGEQRKLSLEITKAMKQLKGELDQATKAKNAKAIEQITEKIKMVEKLVEKAKKVLSGKKNITDKNVEDKKILAIKGQFMDLKDAADKYMGELQVWREKKKEITEAYDKETAKNPKKKLKKPTIPKRPESKAVKTKYEEIKKKYGLENNSTISPTIPADLMKIYSEASKVIHDTSSIQKKYLKYKNKYMMLRDFLNQYTI